MENIRITEREFIPMPCEYLEEMEALSDEDFGRLMRALLKYGMYGTEVTLDGDCRFFCRRVMNKDDYYALRAQKELEKARRRSEAAKRSAETRYNRETEEKRSVVPENPAGVTQREASVADTAGNTCERIRSYTFVDKDKTSQVNSSQVKTSQDKTSQVNNIQQINNISCNTNGGAGESPAAEMPSAAAEDARCGGKEKCTHPQSGFVLALPLVDQTDFEITSEDVCRWQEGYPALDVMQELREMRAWLEANPKNKKTRGGIRRFVVGWLSREQDGARSSPARQSARGRTALTGSGMLKPTDFA